jgi:PAS domain S-box-containing protein
MTALANYILEQLDTLVVVVNRNGEIDFVSPSVKKVLGYEPEKLIGNAWWEKTRKTVNEAELVKESVISIFEKTEQKTYRVERDLIDSMGRHRWILWNLSTAPNDKIVGIGQDITERKCNEQLLLKNNLLLKQKNQEVMDSIKYSERIQKAILPPDDILKKRFSDGFIMFKPKDIVSGDFYWYFEKGNKIFVAGIDCTGHGVPGALMTVLANSLLKNIIVKRN